MWGGDLTNGESDKAGKGFFNTDYNFNIAEYFHFCNRLLKKEPKRSRGRGLSSIAPCMLIFCSEQQIETVKKYGNKYGFSKYIHMYGIKKSSPQVLKVNMRVVGATEHVLLLYRDKLPKFKNNGKMITDWFQWVRDSTDIPRIHPTQKPVAVLKYLIKLCTDEYDGVMDPCAWSGTTLRACAEMNRSCYGFEINKDFCRRANEEMLVFHKPNRLI